MTEPIHAGHRRRLKERFLRDGLPSLTERETLELLLTYAIPQRDVSPQAAALLLRFGSLAGALEADRDALLEVEGIGENAATLLALIPQLAGRYEQSRLGERPRIADAAGAARFAASLFAGAQEERCYLICLDVAGRVRESVLLARGTLDEVPLTPRQAVEQALRARAHAVVLAHNHPGGTPWPSQADVEMTRRIIEALSVVGVRVLDHVIVTARGGYSMARGGLMEAEELPAARALRTGGETPPRDSLSGLGWEGQADRL